MLIFLQLPNTRLSKTCFAHSSSLFQNLESLSSPPSQQGILAFIFFIFFSYRDLLPSKNIKKKLQVETALSSTASMSQKLSMSPHNYVLQRLTHSVSTSTKTLPQPYFFVAIIYTLSGSAVTLQPPALLPTLCCCYGWRLLSSNLPLQSASPCAHR